ncbi:hypothetical protein [Bacillus salipaludis]|uniref:Uncharacterized protein n=1 Tax=Bacillus salipaludis TaxID=2547811 RepID=A0ABW8RKX7_9BACI
MEKSKTLFDHFLKGDRFELHAYLAYLFNQFPEQVEEKMAGE